VVTPGEYDRFRWRPYTIQPGANPIGPTGGNISVGHIPVPHQKIVCDPLPPGRTIDPPAESLASEAPQRLAPARATPFVKSAAPEEPPKFLGRG
jgi:hypothetical protein